MKSDGVYCERRRGRFNKKIELLDNAGWAENDQQFAGARFWSSCNPRATAMSTGVQKYSARCVFAVLCAVIVAVACWPAAAQQRGRGGGAVAGYYKSRIVPHWLEGGSKFWYQNDLAGGKREFILVDVEQGRRERAFDHERLAAALREAGDTAAHADR